MTKTERKYAYTVVPSKPKFIQQSYNLNYNYKIPAEAPVYKKVHNIDQNVDSPVMHISC